jgi:pimeloyl-ACP methyl ester carboxylesterase
VEARGLFARWHRNANAHVRLFEHVGRIAPTLICLHGYRGGHYVIEERLWRAEALWRSGLNVALLTLPFHGLRATSRDLILPIFPDQTNVVRTNEGFGQAIWDLRRLTDWLRAAGSPHVGVAGMSLGGYIASLLATVDASLSLVVPFIPLSDITDAIVRHSALRGVKVAKVLEDASRRAFAIHHPLARQPLLSGDRMLIIAAEYDQVTGGAHAVPLARHFGAQIVWFSGSHILALGRNQVFQTIERFIAGHWLPRRGDEGREHSPRQ